jgi:hypothetical protein
MALYILSSGETSPALIAFFQYLVMSLRCLEYSGDFPSFSVSATSLKYCFTVLVSSLVMLFLLITEVLDIFLFSFTILSFFLYLLIPIITGSNLVIIRSCRYCSYYSVESIKIIYRASYIAKR